MDMKARNQYLHTLITKNKGYHLRPRKEKSAILAEYCKITGQYRKAVSAKIRSGKYIQTMNYETGEEKRTRKSPYDAQTTAYLIKLWEIFDRPCGQRLVSVIKRELERLRRFGELTVSDDMADSLKTISARTIDSKLKTHKQKELLKRKYTPKLHPLLYQKIPVKLSADQKRGIGDTIQIDCVEHCGQSADGTFMYTISTTDIGSGWWEGEPAMGKSATAITRAIGLAQYRFPFQWKEIHPDNGSEFINASVWNYAKAQKLDFSRSRPYMKNDNCFVEQKNSTHVRRIVGYHRYDTKEEYMIIKSLYGTALRLYKNFFQPIIPLMVKERIGGHIRRRYGEPKTPYQRIMENKDIPREIKTNLTTQYDALNPAELKRRIKQHQDMLYRAYQKKQQRGTELTPKVDHFKKLTPRSSPFLFAEPTKVRHHVLIA